MARKRTQTTPQVLTAEQQAALAIWYAACLHVEEAKQILADEQMARATVCQVLAPLLTTGSDEGTQYVNLPNGWKLKRTISYARKIDARTIESLRAPLRELRVSLDRLVDWKPSLVTKEYRELTAEARAILDTAITTTPGLPTLELVPPKVQS